MYCHWPPTSMCAETHGLDLSTPTYVLPEVSSEHLCPKPGTTRRLLKAQLHLESLRKKSCLQSHSFVFRIKIHCFILTG